MSIPASKTLTLDSVSFNDCEATEGGWMNIVLEDTTSNVKFTKEACT